MDNEMQHVDEGTIHAWLDGALPPDESSRVGAHVSACASCAEAVAEARGLIAASSRILASLDAVPGGVIPGAPRDTDRLADLRRRASAPRRRWWRNRQFLAAASLVFIAGTAATAWRVWDRVNAIPRGGGPELVADRAPGAKMEPVAPAPVVTPSVGDDAAGRRAAVAQPKRADAPRQVAAEPPRPSAPPAREAEADVQSSKVESMTAARPADALERSRLAVTRFADSSARAERGAPAAVTLARGAQALNEQRATGQAGAIGALNAASGRATVLTAEAARGRPAATRAGLSLHVGCYVLRSEGEAKTLLLGVPALVRLLDEPVPTDSAWMRATSTEPVDVPASLIWRSIDATTVELHVRRPIDSTVVRFKAVLLGPPLAQVPAVRNASAERVVCPGG